MKSLKLALMLLVCFVFVSEIQAQNGFFNLKQPDGTSFSVKEVGGCCWLSWYETPQGHIVQKGNDGYYHYVNINANGDFVPLPQRAGKDQTNAVPIRPYENPVVGAAFPSPTACASSAF